MSPRIVGPSGQVVDVDESIASGLVAGGHCKYVDEKEAKPDAKDSNEKPQEPATGDGDTPDETKSGDGSEDPQGGGSGPGGDGGDDEKDGRPAGNASRELWVEYALAQGKTEDQLTGLKQTEIRALFADPAE